MFNKKNTQHLDDLEALSTQELEAILQADRQQEDTDDPETVYEALAILEKRGALESCHEDVDAAWKEFQTHYNIPEGDNESLYPCELPAELAAAKKKKRSVWKPLASLAAVFALMLFMAMPVFGQESLFRHIGRWTENVFSFSGGKQHTGYPEDIGGDTAFSNTDLIDVYVELTAKGCEAQVVPTWIPDGYSLRELSTAETPRNLKVFAYFANGEKALSLCFIILTEQVSGYYHEKSDDAVVIENINGIDHYFFQNGDQAKCCWVANNVECSISGDISEEDLQKVIRSIYSEVEESEKNN